MIGVELTADRLAAEHERLGTAISGLVAGHALAVEMVAHRLTVAAEMTGDRRDRPPLGS